MCGSYTQSHADTRILATVVHPQRTEQNPTAHRPQSPTTPRIVPVIRANLVSWRAISSQGTDICFLRQTPADQWRVSSIPAYHSSRPYLCHSCIGTERITKHLLNLAALIGPTRICMHIDLTPTHHKPARQACVSKRWLLSTAQLERQTHTF